jgi:hypothetical protein
LPRPSSSLPGSSASHAIAPLFGLAPDGVCRAGPVASPAVSSYLAALSHRPGPRSRSRPACAGQSRSRDSAPFHPYLCPEQRALRPTLLKGLCRLAAAKSEPSAVCSLLHFPSPHGARPLAGILLCGARTFLHAQRGAQRLPGGLPGRIIRGTQPPAGTNTGLSGPARNSPTERPGGIPLALTQSCTAHSSVLTKYQRLP